ncbi:MAG: hypothetical protein QOK25_1271 [Thermoleophilaceae bacterium]|nr:hypothetical protein [Thermoleophilaceae bacterium]
MGHNPTYKPEEGRRDALHRVEARPQDPRTNTRPRGNGTRERGETEKSTRKLENVLGH